ncbi:MAG: hypothetical protein JWM31_530 [Solirubrobacterales bacterium]|nr:hypothetical protein [Solirubrobacterales bacterium]
MLRAAQAGSPTGVAADIGREDRRTFRATITGPIAGWPLVEIERTVDEQAGLTGRFVAIAVGGRRYHAMKHTAMRGSSPTHGGRRWLSGQQTEPPPAPSPHRRQARLIEARAVLTAPPADTPSLSTPPGRVHSLDAAEPGRQRHRDHRDAPPRPEQAAEKTISGWG